MNRKDLGYYSFAIRENLDYMTNELPSMEIPEALATPIRYALARARGRCDALEGYAQKLDLILGLSDQKPADIQQNPPVLGRDAGLLLHTLKAQAVELTGMVGQFQESYERMENHHGMAGLSVLLHESVGNFLYLRMRMRYILTEAMSRATGLELQSQSI